MTVFVTVQNTKGMTRLRRYESRAPRRPLCTHEGLYDPESVDHLGVHAYVSTGASQDRIAQDMSLSTTVRRPA